ncbi:hypothetical protein, partial [Desulfosarcina sp.]|uniref:hypothetical protein n=1 Tax=Desulfosarcina sp. TaxID=2027861 RepID=UPI0029AB1D13
NRLEEMAGLIKKQNDRLTRRLNDEQSERNEGAEALSQDIVDVKKGLATAMDALAAQQAQDIQNVKEQLTALSNDVSDQIYIQHVELSKNLDQAVQGLDDDKLARKALSQLLMEMAGRLTDTPE